MSISSAAELAKVLGAKKVGSEYLCQCPAHGDDTASLTFKDGDVVPVVVNCKANCSQEDVLNQLLWQFGVDLKRDSGSNGNGKPKVVESYHYEDWDGSLLYVKDRYEPKDFRLRRPNGNGGWIYKMGDTKEVIYRLPVVKKAITDGSTVYVVEGEKDVHSVERLGLTATCNAYGAGKDKSKWRAYHADFLKGVKDVVVLRDYDDAGESHAKAVTESIKALGIPVRVVELPGLTKGQDISDWLAQGGTKEQLLELVAQTQSQVTESAITPFNPETAQHLMKQNFEPPRWAIDDLLPEGLTILAGAPKLGKSWLALDIALCISRGEKVLGDYGTNKGEVLYLALEDSDRRLQRRLSTIADEERLCDNAALFLETEIPGMMGGGIAALEGWLAQHPDCRLVIIDTLARFIPASMAGVNAYKADYDIIARLQTLATKHRIALLIIHHVRKMQSKDVFDEISGSNGIAGPADANWVLKRARTETVGTLTVTGRDIEEMQFSAEFDKESCRWTLLGDARQTDRRKNLVALHKRFGDGPFTFATAKEVLGVSLAHSKRIIGALVSSGHVVRLDEKSGKAFQFRLADKWVNTLPEVSTDDAA